MTVAHPPAIRELYAERHAYWRRIAACRNVPTETFFPGHGDNAGVAAAKEVCAGCPVRVPYCLEFALDTYQSDGVWAGLTDRDLRRLRRERREQVAS